MSITEKHLKVAIYIRVSTKLQEDKYSLKAQQTELTAYAEKMGWSIIGTFKDVESGAKFDKKGLNALLDAAEDHLMDIVLVMDQDRLSRLDMVEWSLLKEVLRENDVKIAEPGSLLDLKNEDEEFFSDLKNLYASYQRRKIKRNTGRGLRQYSREGKVMGKIPGEYIYDKNTNLPVLNEERAWIIPFIDKLFLEEDASMYGIAQELNKLIKTERGRDWTETQVGIRLRSEVYHGVLRRQFTGHEDIVVEDVFPKLRSKETYDRIQAKLADPDRKLIKKKRTFHHALRGVRIKCKHCNRMLKVSRRVQESSGRTYFLVHHKKITSYPCPVDPSFNAFMLTRPLFELVYGVLLDPENINRFTDSGHENDASLSLLEKERDMLRASIEENKEMLSRLLKLYLKGSWSEDELESNKTSIEKEIKTLEDQLSQVERKISLIVQKNYNIDSFLKVIGDVEEYLAIFERMKTLNEIYPFELQEVDQEKLIKQLFDRIEIDFVKRQATIFGKPIQDVPMEFTVDIDEQNLVDDYYNKMKRLDRYYKTVEIAKSFEDPILFMDLARATGHKPETLNADAGEFGPYPNIIPKKGAPERKEWLLEYTKKRLQSNPSVPTKTIAAEVRACSTTIQKLIKEYNLRS